MKLISQMVRAWLRSAGQAQRKQSERRTRLSILELEDRRLLTSAAFDVIGLTALRNDSTYTGIDGSGVTVAVIDTGVDYTHPLLQPAIVTELDRNNNLRLVGRDFIRGDDDPNDLVNHGTHVAGTIGARNADLGVAPAVRLIGLKVSEANSISSTNVEAALRWVIDNKTRYNILVVNMSLGGQYYNNSNIPTNHPYYDEVRQLEQLGVTVVSSAGNAYKYVSDNANSQFGGSLRMVGAPAVFSTLSIGAVWQDGVNNNVRWSSGAIDNTTGSDRLVSFSQRGDTSGVLFAPGAMIQSTLPGNRTGAMAGTSMAAPMVSGVVALLQDAAFTYSRGTRYLTPTEVRDILTSTADVVNDGDNEDDNVRNTGVNFRRVNVHRAVQEVRRRLDTPTPPPPNPGTGDRNGTLATAVDVGNLGNGQSVTRDGSIGTDYGTSSGNADVDIFRINVTTAGTLTAATSARTANNMDTVLRLFNSAGAQLALNDDIDGSLYSRLSANVSAGTYYVGVSGYSNTSYNPTSLAGRPNGSLGDFLLSLSLAASDPNGVVSGATLIGALQGTVTRTGHIGTDQGTLRRDASGQFPTTGGQLDLYVPGAYTDVGATDVDLFRFRAPDNGSLTIETSTNFQDNADGNWSTFNRFPVDTFMRLWELNSDGSFNPARLLASDDDSGPGLGSRIVQSIVAGREYLVGISGYPNTSYDPTTLASGRVSGSTGFFQFAISLTTPDADGIINPATTALNPTTPVTNRAGSIGSDGATTVGNLDVDIQRIRSSQAGLVEFRVDSHGSSAIAAGQKVDTVLQLFDASGRRIAMNDDTNGLDPLLRYNLQANTDYYLAISAYPNTSFDPLVRASGVAGGTGSYLFSTRMLSSSSVRSNNNNSLTAGTARTIVAGQSLSDQLGSDQTAEQVADGYVGLGSAGVENLGQDIDLFVYQATRNEVVTLRASPDILGGADLDVGADVILRVFDSASRLVAESTSSGALGNVLQFQATAGQVYYIGVSGYGSGNSSYNPLAGQFASSTFAGATGAYRLSLDAAPIPDTVRGDVTSRVRVQQLRQLRRGNKVVLTLRLQNIGGAAVAGPLALVFEGMPRNVQLVGGTKLGGAARSATQKLRAVVSGTSLAASQEVTVDLTFRLSGGARRVNVRQIRVFADA